MTAFTFNIMATATPLTAAEFIAQQTQEAEQLRQAILNDPDRLVVADGAGGECDELGRPVSDRPDPGGDSAARWMSRHQVRENPLVVSMEATLAAGILAGPAGDQIITTGNLTQFFAEVRTWYGNDPTADFALYRHRRDRFRRRAASTRRPIRRRPALQPERIAADAIRGLRRLCAVHQ